MLDAVLPGSRTLRRTTSRQTRWATAVIAVLGCLLTSVLAIAFTGTPAHAAGADPLGSFDSVTLNPDGTVSAAGWAVDPDSVKAAVRVVLLDNGAAKTTMVANQSRPDVAAAYPSYGDAHGFRFRLLDADGVHNFCLVVQNIGAGANSQLGCRSVTVANNPSGTMSAPSLSANTVTFTGTAVDANSAAAVSVRAYRDGALAAAVTTAPDHSYQVSLPVAEGNHQVCLYAINIGAGANTTLGCVAVPVHNNPLGALESVRQVPTGVLATGYAIDLNTPTAAIGLMAFVDGSMAARAVAATPRPELASRYPSAGPDHGFSIPLNPAAGAHTVCLWALNAGPGANTLLGCQRVTVQNNPIGSVNSAGQVPAGIQLTGWALDLNSSAAVTVTFTVDGKAAGSTSASLPRPDVAVVYPAAGANRGYSIALAAATGTHQVCVTAVNLGAGTNSVLGCVSVRVSNNPMGTVETTRQVPGGVQLHGWALDLNSTAPVSLFVFVDGRFSTRVAANETRPDVAKVYPTVGPGHGYTLIVPVGPGKHTVCTWAINIGPGTNSQLNCGVIILADRPLGSLETAQLVPGGARLAGWAMDSFSTSPSTVRIYVDGQYTASTTAGQVRTDIGALYPNMGAGHGFVVLTPLPVGQHSVCAYVINPRHAANLATRCVQLTRLTSPVGVSTGIARVGVSNTVAVSGWALDPDTTAPIQLHVTSDGIDKQVITASAGTVAAASAWPLYGVSHGYSVNVTLDPGEHRVCVLAYNVGSGANTTLGCAQILTSGDGAPAMPGAITAWAGSHSVTLSWTAPRSVNAPITEYLVTVLQRGTVVTVGGTATSATVGSLTNGGHYTFTVRAVNSFGAGSAASTGAIPTNIPPQVTPAPVSTSHYLRNLSGNLASDAAMMRSMGATDASHNPTGHSYLVLLQIGGQDEINQGALLSATSRFVTYPAVVSAVRAYLDGYATQQRPYAPLTLAVGTNNDVDVNASAGISWARNVVVPIAAYAAAHHAGTIVAGANDMEPGFSASVAQTRSWLVGYLSATSAPFVFNGSADGCSTWASGSRCNNGWTMADLQYVSGGAAPSRMISLPQIYNYAMPLQWEYISLTGTSLGRARLYFGGPLTEATACAQAGSCGSISNVDAWSRLWSAISSSSATRQFQMPHGTDLRIN